jgi:hypothetical protein
MKLFRLLIGSLLLFLLAACAQESLFQMDLVLTPPPAALPSNNAIVLVVTPELKSLSDPKTDANIQNARLGDAIIRYSDQMLRSISAQVQQTDPGGQTAVKGRFFVTPTEKRYELMVSGREIISTMALEWRVLDTAGKTIFLDTVVGEGTRTAGFWGAPVAEYQESVGRMLQDVFTKSRARLAPVLSTP